MSNMYLLQRMIHHFLTRKIIIAKWQLNGFGVIMLSIGFLACSYLTARHFIDQIFADGQASITVATDTGFNQGTLASLQVNGTGTDSTISLQNTAGPSNDIYKVPITINNSSNANTLTNYQVSVTLNTATLIAGSKMLSDCRDIRFRDSDQVTDISNYWIENCNNSATKIWVKVPSISANSSKTIYLYYGGPSSSTAQSSTANTFIDDISGLIGAWDFEEGQGSTTTDLSGQNNTGSWAGTLGSQWTSGHTGGGGNFNGTNNKVTLTAMTTTQTRFTIGAWVNPQVWGTSSDNQYIINKSSFCATTQSDFPFGLYVDGTGTKYTTTLSAGTDWVGQNEIASGYTANTWHYVVSRYDGSNFQLYVDGALAAGTIWSGNPSSNARPYTIGAPAQTHNGCGTHLGYFKGIIDEPRIYSQALTPTQVAELYSNYGYVTTNYPGHELVRQFSTPEPTTSVGSESPLLAVSGTWESASNSDVLDLVWNGGWGDGSTAGSTAFSATIASVSANQTIAFQMRVAASTGALSSAAYVTLGTANSGTTFTATKAQLDGLGLGVGTNRYAQIKITLAQTTGISPTLDAFTIYYANDNTAPEVNASSPLMFTSSGGTSIASNGWDTAAQPYFTWTAGSDSQSGIKGYCLYLGASNSADPATSSPGNLAAAASPVSATGTNCGAGSGFIVSGTSLDLTTAGYLGTALTSGSSPYYLGIAAVDNAGTVDSSFTFFPFKYDGITPTNLTYIACPGGSFSTLESMNFSWPTSGNTASSDATSGVLGWQYQIDTTSGSWQGTTYSSLLNLDYIPATASAYTLLSGRDSIAGTTGTHVVYFRTVDLAGNTSSPATYRTCSLSFGGGAPTFPGDGIVTTTPASSDTNSFALSWPTATAQDGNSITHYYYMVNNAPPSSLSTLQGNSGKYIDAGTATSVTAGALANISKGTNTVYVVAIDSAGTPNYAASNVVTGTFTLNSNSPDPVQNIVATDSSIKSQSQWNVTLTWTAGSYQGAGNLNYLVYRSSDNVTFSQVGTSTGLSFVDSTPSSSSYYYYVVTKDAANALSANSNTVSITPTGRYTSAPNLQAEPSAQSITTQQATITWSTDRNGDSKVAYGVSSDNYNTTQPYVLKQVTSHEVTIDNLTPGTTYFYKVYWTDTDGNTGSSTEHSFTTSPPPTVQDVSVSGIDLSSGLVTFTANGASSVKIYYGITTGFGSVITIPTSTSSTTYSSLLTGLLDGTKYYFKINGLDTKQSEYQGTILNFTTLPRPRISTIQLAQVAGTAQPSVLVNWTTNTDISSIVTYYPTSKPSNSLDNVDVALTRGTHQMILSGLDPQTTYSLVVKGRDKVGNEAISDVQTFTTATDTRPPYVSSLNIEGESIPAVASAGQTQQAQLVVTWNTDKPATSQVEFGEGTGATYTQKTQQDSNYTFNHLVIISGLTPSKVYHLKAVSVDKYNNTGSSIDTVTITPKATDNALNLIISNLQQAFGFLGAVTTSQ